MLTITTADPSNTQTKLKRIIEVPRCPGKSQIAKTIINIPTDATPHQLDPIYQALLDDDIDLYNPHLTSVTRIFATSSSKTATLKLKSTTYKSC